MAESGWITSRSLFLQRNPAYGSKRTLWDRIVESMIDTSIYILCTYVFFLNIKRRRVRWSPSCSMTLKMKRVNSIILSSAVIIFRKGLWERFHRTSSSLAHSTSSSEIIRRTDRPRLRHWERVFSSLKTWGGLFETRFYRKTRQVSENHRRKSTNHLFIWNSLWDV